MSGLAVFAANNQSISETLTGTSATIATGTTCRGSIIANTSITMTSGATTTGKLFAITGAVTLDTNTVDAVPTTSPHVSLYNSVTPSGTQSPGTDLVYTVVFTSSGGQAAQVFIIVDPKPENTDFKLGSVRTALGTTGLTVTVAYSNDGGASYTYPPASGGGGAPAGYDRLVTHIRWTFGGSLSQTTPNNAGSISFTVRVR